MDEPVDNPESQIFVEGPDYFTEDDWEAIEAAEREALDYLHEAEKSL